MTLNIFCSLFSLFLLGFAWVSLQRSLDSLARQHLFDIRWSLFCLARDGVIAFDSPAYLLLRQSINGHIRWAHRMRFVPGILEILCFEMLTDGRAVRSLWTARVAAASADLSDAQRAALSTIRQRVSNATTRHLLATSPTLWVVAVVVAMIAIPTLIVRHQLRPMLTSATARIRAAYAVLIEPVAASVASGNGRKLATFRVHGAV